MEILGQIIDDVVGEVIDKCLKVMGFGYLGGFIIDCLVCQGNLKVYIFSKFYIFGLDYSFSGLKMLFFYFLCDWMKEDFDFIEYYKNDLVVLFEVMVVDILMDKFCKVVK